ncbi:MAG: DUF5928 domain-containing protein [Paracoccaceae bacterium]
MAKIAFILLCHKDPKGVILQAESLTAAGDYVAIHFDARARSEDFQALKDALGDNPNVAFAKRRVKCGWGEWSLISATLSAVRAAVEAFPRATHFYMLSGDCMPIKTAEYIHDFLDRNEADFIEAFDFFKSDWIKTGIKEERLVYRHYFNERLRKKLFYGALGLQKRLGIRREVPADLQVMIGSQWWCLRRQTVEAVLTFCAARRDVMRFFSTTWIPDETFFQTLVHHLVPHREIRLRTLTFLMFSDYGMPVTFYNDQYDLLMAQDFLFARKISPDAQVLKERLSALFLSSGQSFTISNEGRRLHQFLTSRGREGRRFAPRIWEANATFGRNRELLLVVCKKWHVAKRLVARIRETTNLAALEYVFSELQAPLPDLGGIESSLEKRGRHCRAFLRLMFDVQETDRMLVCLDPSSFEMMKDFYTDKASVRMLEISCNFTDDYLIGHSRRVGLSGDSTPLDVIERLLPTIRHDVTFESERIRDANFPRTYRMFESRSPAQNAHALAAFLTVSTEVARDLAATDYLYAD